ncbi:MAG: helix-turn-helix transcriptional regulator [Actinobacteria bacterium]|nr:helix-turn-helix transcriptional regulator [Actinomycetota bacterium]
MEEQIIRRREEARRHPTRRALLGLLGEAEMTTRELRDRLPDEPSLSDVVYHLAVLQAVGLVDGPVQGRYRSGA